MRYFMMKNKVIGIIIIDYELEKTKEIKELSTKWKITEVLTGKKLELTDVLELYIIEIPKRNTNKGTNKSDCTMGYVFE